jgi:Mg2+ and Co2+ transporter CorA
MKVSPASDLDSFFKALHGKAWIEVLTATQDEIDSLSRQKQIDPLTAYLQELKEFEAYLLNPKYPLPEKYQTVIRNMHDMHGAPETNKAQESSG